MQRLRLSKDIQTVYRRGVKRFHPFFRTVFLKTQESESRATVVVSTRVSKKAVERNRIKRRLRPILKKILNQAGPSRDVVVVVQQRALQANTAELEQALRRLL